MDYEDFFINQELYNQCKKEAHKEIDSCAEFVDILEHLTNDEIKEIMLLNAKCDYCSIGKIINEAINDIVEINAKGKFNAITD